MNEFTYDSPSSIKALLESENLAMSKRFGQNFLIDRNARERLVEVLEISEESSVWEIGPGIGSITLLLLEKQCRVKAFEIDYGFIRVLEGLYGQNPAFSLVAGDFLKTWEAEAEKSGRPDRIFGNLPYNAALAIIADLLEEDFVPEKMVFTVQKEAALRIAGKPGNKDYSALSVLCSSVCDIKILYDIGASSFWPQPRVTSSVVVLKPRANPIAATDRKGFSRFVRTAFSSRRKTLKNNISHDYPVLAENLETILQGMNLSPSIRAEALRPEQLWAVYEAARQNGASNA